MIDNIKDRYLEVRKERKASHQKLVWLMQRSADNVQTFINDYEHYSGIKLTIGEVFDMAVQDFLAENGCFTNEQIEAVKKEVAE